MKDVKLASHYGPGGRNCTCCGPAPSFRKKHDRMIKRRAKKQAMAEVLRDFIENSNKLA